MKWFCTPPTVDVSFNVSSMLLLVASLALAGCACCPRQSYDRCGCTDAPRPSQSGSYPTTTSVDADVRSQQEWYLANKATVDTQYSGKWVVIAGNQVFAADDLATAEAEAMRAFPGRQFFATLVPRPAQLPLQPAQR